MVGESVFAITDVSLWRNGRCLVTNLDLQIQAGQLVLMVGANGTGKTSLLRVLAGLAVPASGTVAFNGEPIRQLVRENRSPICYQGHVNALKRDLTVIENIEFYRKLVSDDGNAGDVLGPLQLASCRDRLVRHLSAGQRRRAALSRLSLSRAPIWLLDEPFTNLDRDGRKIVMGWLQDHLRNSGMAIVATHEPLAIDGVPTFQIEL
jgi:heme exporter protein A